MRLSTHTAPILLLIACGSAGDTSPAAAAPAATGAAAPPATTTGPAVTTGAAVAPTAQATGAAQDATLPDLSKGLEIGSCGDGPGNEGADSHFLGEFTVNGTSVTGTERWLLNANDKLQASKLWGAGPACEVRWMLTGTVTPPRHCGTCDLGLDLKANADLTGSTCPEDLVKREASFSVSYDVRRGSDGVAYVYFANSGKLLGQGYHQTEGETSRFNYVTQHQCKWF